MKDNAVVFIFDIGYLLPTLIAFRSFLCHRNIASSYDVYFVTDEKCEKICKENFDGEIIENVHINYICPDINCVDFSSQHTHVTQTALLKFWLPLILDKCDTVLYLDGDIIIRSNVDKLFEIQLDDEYVAAVEDEGVMLSGHHRDIGVERYFNSGVMVLNLKKMRENHLTEKLLGLKKAEQEYFFMDQDAFNKAFGGAVLFLPNKYNYIYDNIRHSDDNEVKQDDIVIIHMAGAMKPWTTYESEQFEEWVSYIKTKKEIIMFVQALHRIDFGYVNAKNIELESGINNHIKNIIAENNKSIDVKLLEEREQLQLIINQLADMRNEIDEIKRTSIWMFIKRFFRNFITRFKMHI